MGRRRNGRRVGRREKVFIGERQQGVALADAAALQEKESDEEEHQHRADENCEEEDVHSRAGGGGLLAGFSRGESEWLLPGACASRSPRPPHRQLPQFVQRSGSVAW